METTVTSTAGLIPVSLSLVGLLAALQYLKGMTDYAAAVRLVFFGFAFLFVAKVLALAASLMPTDYYYAAKLTLCLWSAVFLAAGGLKIKGVKLFNFTVTLSSCLLAAVWSWYVVIGGLRRSGGVAVAQKSPAQFDRLRHHGVVLRLLIAVQAAGADVVGAEPAVAVV